MKRLQNKVALVTSASKGIGLACALRLAEEGARVCMGVRRMEDTQKICDEYKERGIRYDARVFEAMQEDSYASMVDDVITKTGRLDILVNNFGVGRPSEDLDLIRSSEKSFL